MSGHWHYDGVDIDTCAFAVKNRDSTWKLPARRGDNYYVPGRDGTVYNPDKATDENTLVLSMFAAGATLEGKMPTDTTRARKVRQHLDVLTRLFGAKGLKELVHSERDDYGRVNMVPNPSFENQGRKVVARENQVGNPSAENSSGDVAIRYNFADNPGCEDASAEKLFRTNLARNPRMAGEQDPVVAVTNWVPNPSAEAGLRFWRARTNCKITESRKERPDGGWPIQGQKSVRMVALADGNMVAECGSIPVESLGNHTFSVYAWNRAEFARTVRVSARWFSGSGGLLGTSANTDLSVAIDEYDRVVAAGLVAPSGAKTASLRITVVGALEGDVAYLDGAMCTRTSTVRTYFDGDTLEDDGYRHRWVGDEHRSRSQRYSVAPWGWTSTHTLSCSTARSRRGSQSARVECTSATSTGDLLLRQTVPGGGAASEGDWLSASIEARLHPDVDDAVVRSVQVGLRCYDSHGNNLGKVKDATQFDVPDVTLALDSGAWQTVTFEAGTALADTARVAIEVRCGEAWSSGDVAYFDTALIENAKKVGEYFDGSTGDDDVFTYEWNATPHRSESYCRGHNILRWDAEDGRQYQMARGRLRDHAMRLVPYRSPASADRPRATSLALDVRPGRTHTLSAMVRSNRVFNFKAGISVDNGKTWTYGAATAMQVGNWVRVSQVMAIADTVNENRVRIAFSYDAAPNDADEIDIDEILFEPTGSVRNFFDGDSGKRYDWRGDPDRSVSVQYADRVNGWNAYGNSRPSLWRVGGQLTHGTYAARARANEDGNLGVTFGQDSINERDDYSFGIDVVARTTARAVVAGIAWYDSKGDFISESLGASTTPAVGSVVRKTVTAAVPADADVAAPFVRYSGVVAGNVFDFDAAIFGFGANTTYADGDSGNGWEWVFDEEDNQRESRQMLDGVDYWRCDTAGTLVQSTAWATSRDESALYTVTGSNATNRVWAVAAGKDDQTRFRIVRDGVVTFAVDVRAVDACRVVLELDPYKWRGQRWVASSTAPVVGTGVDLAAGEDRRIWVTGEFASGDGDGSHFVPTVRVKATGGGNPVVGTRIRLDSATVSRDEHHDYIDGTFQYVIWTGDEDASPSKRVGPARRIFVERRAAVDFSSIGYGTSAEFAVSLVAPDPYFEDTIVKTQSLALPRRGGVLRFDGFQGVTAPIHDAEITLWGPFNDLILTDLGSGEWFRLNMRVRDDVKIVLDNVEWRVDRGNGKTVIGEVRYSGGSVLMPVTVPSDDDVPRIRVEADNIGRGAKIQIRAREKYAIS